MSATLPWRRCYGERNTVKRVARDLDTSVGTAKRYVAEGPPSARLVEILDKMQAQLDRQLAELAEAEADLTRRRRSLAAVLAGRE